MTVQNGHVTDPETGLKAAASMLGCSPWSALGDRCSEDCFWLAAGYRFQVLSLCQGRFHQIPVQQGDVRIQDPKPESCISLLLDSVRRAAFRSSTRAQHCLQEAEVKEEVSTAAALASSPGAGLRGARAVLHQDQSHSHGAGCAALLPSSLDSSLAVPSGSPPQWFIDSSLPPTAPLRPCTHNT